MNSKLAIGTMLTIIFSFVFLAFLSSKSFSQVTEVPIEINISDVKPKVREVKVGPLVSGEFVPQEAGIKELFMWADIIDPNGDLSTCRGDLWNATTTRNPPLTTSNTRYTNTSCSFSGTGSFATCNCSFKILYYDENSTWAGNITGIDSAAYTGFNSTPIVVAELSAYVPKPDEGIVFPSTLFVGFSFNATNNPWKINNTGNVKLKVYINASDFVGQDNPSEILKIKNMTYNSTYPGMATLAPITTTPAIVTPAEGIPVFPNSLSGITNKATFWMFHYLNIPETTYPQVYTTTYMVDPSKL